MKPVCKVKQFGGRCKNNSSKQSQLKEFSAFVSIPDICHGHTDGVREEKICHVEKFQISVHDR